ncbi:MAG: hypothetical protein QOI20_1541 [Acidimicrobiaceae bacterium]|jgi:uncharacterized glyoxalase superfamily protein PhnB|nr:hypothetical protein [Acidimicrobiaceae bacterium]
METNTQTNAPTVWPALRYADAKAAIRFLVDAFGFQETLVVPGEGEGEPGAEGKGVRDVVHAELRWPEGGGVMLGSTEFTEGVHAELPAGSASVYVVTDQPDALFERATAAGAAVVQGLRDEDYGSRGFTVRDPEGNYWSFGTYRGV